MFALSARKVAIVAVLGLGSALSIGVLAAQASPIPTNDDVVRPSTAISTDDGTGAGDVRGDGTPEDNGVDDGLRGDGTVDDDGTASTPGALPTDADHPQGDDSIGRADGNSDDNSADHDNSDDNSGRGDNGGHDASDDGDASDDNSGHGGHHNSEDGDGNSGHGGDDD